MVVDENTYAAILEKKSLLTLRKADRILKDYANIE